MPKDSKLNKVLVIGSGPIVIGQAAEFDYAGTQALEALREEGIETVLINSNPATIMTDQEMADKVYLEPLTKEFLLKVTYKEQPDGILATLGGQTGLNLARALYDDKSTRESLFSNGLRLLGTDIESIKKAEDREEFRSLMKEIGEPVPASAVVHNIDEAIGFVETGYDPSLSQKSLEQGLQAEQKPVGYPVIVRPAYTLGGSGGGIANSEEELRTILANGLKQSPINQCLIEQSIAGFKEIEYEVMRDANDNCIVVCNMENIDPVGVHTGDSIVVAPSQTLADKEYQLLRSSALRIIRALKIEGGCNVQYALDPKSFQYYVIEVNPRVSRSSALASKATGYPIAKLAAKIAVGYSLDEIINPVTKNSYASFEPTLDYIVSKIPRWPFDKFFTANRKLGTQMKATGEVMAIGRNFEESILKAIRSLEIDIDYLEYPHFDEDFGGLNDEKLEARIARADDERLFILGEALRRGLSVEKIHEISEIDLFFLHKLKNIIDIENEMKSALEGHKLSSEKDLSSLLSRDLLYRAKRIGISDQQIARILNQFSIDSLGNGSKLIFNSDHVRDSRKAQGIIPVYKMVDTCAAEFASETPYFYSSYEEEDEVEETDKEKILVLGSGPIRIGQGIEFDYVTVHAVKAIQEAGYEAIIINNNPETVSTDFSISDRLYFEPLFLEDVLNVIDREKPMGVVVQFGGQTAINLAEPLHERGVKILGSSIESIDRAEDRKKFEETLRKLGVAQPIGKTVHSLNEAMEASKELGFPLVVRPSYVLGGRAMQIVYDEDELREYIQGAINVGTEHPILVDRYMIGRELEVDAICDGKDVLIPGIMEHVERAGVHSGDSIAVYPTQTIYEHLKREVIEITQKIALELNTIGLLNIQFVISQDTVYVIEVNPRSSRTVPFLSKITNVPMAKIATKIIAGKSLRDCLRELDINPEEVLPYYPEANFVSVKAPVFSFAKLDQVEVALGPEMKSTGEVMGRDASFAKALYKGLLASGIKVSHQGSILVTIADKDKEESLDILQRFRNLGFKFYATAGTADFLSKNGIAVETVKKITAPELKDAPDIVDVIRNGKVDLMLNTITKGKASSTDGFMLRREAVENGIFCLTSLDTAEALLKAIEAIAFSVDALPKPSERRQSLLEKA